MFGKVLLRLHCSSINTLIYFSQVEIFCQKAVVSSDTYIQSKDRRLRGDVYVKILSLRTLALKKTNVNQRSTENWQWYSKTTVNGRSFEDKLLLFLTLKGTGVPCWRIVAFEIKAFPPIFQWFETYLSWLHKQRRMHFVAFKS